MKLEEILDAIRRERERQNAKWGNEFDDKNTANDWVAYVCAYAGQAGIESFPGYSAKEAGQGIDLAEFKSFMLKAATIAVAAIEAAERNGKNFPKRHYD